MAMKVRLPKASETNVGTPNIRITTPRATPVSRAFVGNTIATSSRVWQKLAQGAAKKAKGLASPIIWWALFRNASAVPHPDPDIRNGETHTEHAHSARRVSGKV